MNQASPEVKSIETDLARITILPEKALIKALADMVTDIAESCGIGRKESENLDRVLADIMDNNAKVGFEGERRKPIDVVISRRLHALVIAIEDKGLPDRKST